MRQSMGEEERREGEKKHTASYSPTAFYYQMEVCLLTPSLVPLPVESTA